MTSTPARNTDILVLDDDRELADTLQDFLTSEGYTVATANSPAAALDFYENNPQLALALLDLVMPESSGLSVMEALHRKNSDLPVVIMTGFGTIDTAVDAIKRGAEDYITKPFDREAVRKKVGRITTSGTITEFPTPSAPSAPFGIITGPDGNLWFAEDRANKIAFITPS